MRVLLDENLPLDFAAEIRGHAVQAVRGLGWTGSENGDLMRLAATVCDVFVTMDQNLSHEQHVPRLPFGLEQRRPEGVFHVFRHLVQALLAAANPFEGPQRRSC